MKILFLSAYYKPEIAASLYLKINLTEMLAYEGEEVQIIAPNPVRGISNELTQKYRKDKSLKNQTEFEGALNITRIFVPFTENGGIFKRFLRYFFVYKKLYRAARKIKSDIIWVSSTPPVLFLNMAGKIAKKTGAKVIYNVQDIFPESLVSMKKIAKGGFLEKKFQKFDKKSYKNADHIITISEEFKKILVSVKGVPQEKISVVYNWVEEDKVKPVEKENNSLYNIYNIDKSKFYISYCGNIGLSQSLETLVETAENLRDNKNIGFIVVGDGANKKNLLNIIKEKKIDNIIFLPFQPYEKIADVFNLGDVGLVISKQGTGKSSLPSKTWSIMSAEKPVLASFDDGELTDIIKRADCGICIPPENAEELKKAILNLYKNKDFAVKMGRNGRDYVLKYLTKDYGTGQIYDIIKSVYAKNKKQ